MGSLQKCKNGLQKIIITLSVYEIEPNSELIRIAINALKEINSKWDLIFSFHYLGRFNDLVINKTIAEYITDIEYSKHNSKDFLISYNAKRALGLVD